MVGRKANHWVVQFIILLLLSLLVGCTAQPAQDLQAGLYPTPTPGPHLQANSNQNLMVLNNTGEESQAIPTVSDLFRDSEPTAGPEVSPLPAPTTTVAPYTDPDLKTKSVVIFNEELNPNWNLQSTPGVEVDFGGEQPAHSGTASIEITPTRENGMFLITVGKNTSENYLRDEVFGLSFWINSGEDTLWTDALSVTVLGSNSYPYWVPDDHSVENAYEPVFSETRLYYLGINQPVPPNTWVQVELWLDDRIYDPDYQYVTGFYIKNDDSVLRSIYIDDIELITMDAADASQSGTAAADGSGQAAAGSDGSNQIVPLWMVQVDAAQLGHRISPLIYGVSAADPEYLENLRLAMNSWGGNPSTRYNWKIGHAWNAGRDYFFKNGNNGILEGSASDSFVEGTIETGAEVRLAVPTLGWVAKNDNLNTCSFPQPNGECSDIPEASCDKPIVVADPNLANVPSDVDSIREWMIHLFKEKAYKIRFIAMDNEPELWGYTHYDVHPDCTTYQEILEKHLEYSMMVREVAPKVEISGPVTSGWYYYWNSAAGDADKAKNGGVDFLPWFLGKVREHDLKNKVRTLDVLDIHFYPQGVYNNETDQAIAALRLRSTRSLWDPIYEDESWIAQPVYLIPRLKQVIEENYPGTRLGISEWNWGADATMNGALAIADVLGIYGREDLYYASYWTFPPEESPGYFAFKMFTNFDDLGSRFGDISVFSQSTDSDVVSSFSALNSKTNQLHLMLINKDPDREIPLKVYLKGFQPKESAELFQYSQEDLTSIANSRIKIPSENFEIELPPYSISLLVFDSAGSAN